MGSSTGKDEASLITGSVGALAFSASTITQLHSPKDVFPIKEF
jgi:hypothetical protein